jgi:hypothetical protein
MKSIWAQLRTNIICTTINWIFLPCTDLVFNIEWWITQNACHQQISRRKCTPENTYWNNMVELAVRCVNEWSSPQYSLWINDDIIKWYIYSGYMWLIQPSQVAWRTWSASAAFSLVDNCAPLFLLPLPPSAFPDTHSHTLPSMPTTS